MDFEYGADMEWRERIKKYIGYYQGNRTIIISTQHQNFKQGKANEFLEELILAYSYIDTEIPIRNDSIKLDHGLMYIDIGNKLHSLCPYAHIYFKSLIRKPEHHQMIWKKFLNMAETETTGSIKGGLFKLMIKHYFMYMVESITEKEKTNIEFSGKTVLLPGEPEFLFNFHVDKFVDLMWKRKEISIEYYKDIFEQHKNSNTMFVTKVTNFPGVNLVFSVHGKTGPQCLYGINVTINILNHDKSPKNSPETFYNPLGESPQVATAFKEVFPDGKVLFMWLGGKSEDEAAIVKKIIENGRACAIVMAD